MYNKVIDKGACGDSEQCLLNSGLLDQELDKLGVSTVGRAGEYVQSGSYRVFVPKPLPPSPALKSDNEMGTLLQKAAISLGRLEGLSEIIPNPEAFISMYVRKEALLSSQIEGTQASYVDVLASEDRKPSSVSSDVLEVVNYVKALNYALQRVSELPFSLRLLREVHEILLSNQVRGSNRRPGEFRTVQNWIGANGTSPTEAEFVPPSPEIMSEALREFERYYHEGTEPPLIKCGLLHAQFETIHPFMDGNGRIGRLLISFFLREQRVLMKPLLYLSHYFKKKRMQYYDALMAVRDEGDWEGWLKFFLTGVNDVSEEAVTTAKALLQAQQEDRNRIRETTNTNNAVRLHEYAFEKPVFTLPDVRKKLKWTNATALNLIGKLERCGVLSEITGQSRNRVWAYTRVIDIMQAGTTPL